MPAQDHEVLFEEEQSFRPWWIWGLLASILLCQVVPLIVLLSVAPVNNGANKGSAILGLSVGIAVSIAATLLISLLKLSVRLDDVALHVRYFPLVKKDIPLQEITEYEARTYNPLLEYGGWGIRYGWKGKAYNARGSRGVQLALTNGKRLLIGSQRPEELAAAIGQAKQAG